MRTHIRLFIYGCWRLVTEFLMWLPFYSIRTGWLKIFLKRLGRKNAIKRKVDIRLPSRIEIGDNNTINQNVLLDGRGGLCIGNNVDIAQEVNIWTAEHDYNSSQYEGVTGKVIIEDYVWVASRATILPGCTLHKGSVVAAGAVVTKDVPSMAIVGGVPARIIGWRNCELKYRLGERIFFE